jgi:hypothetical protein
MKAWDPENKLTALADEINLSDGNETEAAKRIFKESAVLAAQAICHIAVYDDNSRVRLDAAKYVVERNLGKLGDPTGGNESEDIFDVLLKDIVKEARA